MNVLEQAVIDRYRCPESYFNFQLSGSLSEDSGFFQFGPGTLCFARSVSGFRSRTFRQPLYDALSDTFWKDGTLSLPFNPTEAIQNFFQERYVCRSEDTQFRKFMRSAYYSFRPWLGRPIRKHLQRLHAHGWKKRAFPRWPVDSSVENLCEKLLLLVLQRSNLDRIPFVWFWPKGAVACLMMTHDVETETGRDFCPILMDINDSFGLKSSFQIVPEKRYKVEPAFLKNIRERGFEVNVQDLNHDGLLFADQEEFQRRARLINSYVKEYGASGFRSAVLYRRPDWYDAFDFSFDMSIPNVAHLDPQKGGCCTVMPYFIGNMLELPLTTIQDYMLFHLLQDYSLTLWTAQSEQILAKNGLLCFLVHPDYLDTPLAVSTYRELVAYIKGLQARENIWHALPSECNQWWRSRSQMRIVPEGRSWRIEGKDSDRAVLAYAIKDGDSLRYEIDSQVVSSLPNETR